jgi:hypothetical protein
MKKGLGDNHGERNRRRHTAIARIAFYEGCDLTKRSAPMIRIVAQPIPP